jgi:hypothetical protein
MRLKLTCSKEYDNEANMRAQRDNILDKLADAGFDAHWTVEE